MVGIDTGGTFTDFIYCGPDGLRFLKRLSTPENPARAVLAGLAELLPAVPRARGSRPGPVEIVYGSTVATNAILERRGARVLLLTTRGFEDLLEIGRQARPKLYALEPERSEPLVPARRRLGVAERASGDGKILRSLEPAELRSVEGHARRLKAESIAVCFLHSYAEPKHERRMGRALRAVGVPVSLSHELVSEYREYERLSTTVANAYVAPVMSRHIDALRCGVGRNSLRVMQSNGGAVSVATASREAVRTLLSGPAGGVIGAVAAARRVGVAQVITFDMGGTSTDVSLVDGEVRLQTEWEIGGIPVKVPAIDIHTVGAGGGSLARRDAGGALKVGPQSAGADPGPACYGRGVEPTVTDADLVLGRLPTGTRLGGCLPLDGERARRAVGGLGERLGLDVETTASGIVRVVNSGMERAIRRISVERGHDPRSYTLVAFGGAAGMHACELADSLGMARILVPIQAGLLSAWGAIAADVQRDYVRTVRRLDPGWHELEGWLVPIRRRAERELRREGVTHAAIELKAALDVRYQGQSHEIRVEMSRKYREVFAAEHRRLFGYADAGRTVEVVNLRLTALARCGRTLPAQVTHTSASPALGRMRVGGRWRRVPIYERESLPARALRGPLIARDVGATVVVPPGWTLHAYDTGDLLLCRLPREGSGR